MKIHIIGGPAGGKTTLARRLGSQLGLPVWHLDDVWFGGERPLTIGERLAAVHDIAAGDAWVTEGVYLDWAQLLAESSDVIVWLDMSRPVVVKRILVRHLMASLRRNNKHKGLRKLAIFTRWSISHYYRSDAVVADLGEEATTANRHATELWLRQYGSKVRRCRTGREAKQLALRHAERDR